MRSQISVCLSTMALAACTSGSVGMSPDLPVGETVTSVARGAIAKHTDLRHSWISPRLGKSKTPSLFVSDPGTADVYIYKLSNLKLIATITGFSQPQGECSDSRGNVWIADTNARIIYELSHHDSCKMSSAIRSAIRSDVPGIRQPETLPSWISSVLAAAQATY